MVIPNPTPIVREVPCNGCVACCRQDLILLKPHMGDKPKRYIYKIVDNQVALEHKKNGDCIYLDREKGCTIWHRRPVVCQEFDCRAVVRHVPEHILVDFITRDVIEKGKELLSQSTLHRY